MKNRVKSFSRYTQIHEKRVCWQRVVVPMCLLSCHLGDFYRIYVSRREKKLTAGGITGNHVEENHLVHFIDIDFFRYIYIHIYVVHIYICIYQEIGTRDKIVLNYKCNYFSLLAFTIVASTFPYQLLITLWIIVLRTYAQIHFMVNSDNGIQKSNKVLIFGMLIDWNNPDTISNMVNMYSQVR